MNFWKFADENPFTAIILALILTSAAIGAIQSIRGHNVINDVVHCQPVGSP